MDIIIALMIALGLISAILAYIATKGDTVLMKVIPLVLCFIFMTSIVVVLRDANDITMNYVTTIIEADAVTTTVASTVSYTIPTGITGILDNFVVIFMGVGTFVGLLIGFMWIVNFVKEALTRHNKRG